MKWIIALAALLVLTIGGFIGYTIYEEAQATRWERQSHQATMNQIAEDRAALALERQQQQAELATTTAPAMHSATTIVQIALLILVPILAFGASYLAFIQWHKRARVHAPDPRTGLLPVTEAALERCATMALQGYHTAAIESARASGRVPASVHYAPNIEVEEHAPAQVLPADTTTPPAETKEPQQIDLATLKVDLLSRLHPTTGGGNILLGVDERGQEIRGDIHSMMHTLSAATTGGGKTTLLSSLGLQLAFDPSVALVVADPHLQELAILEDTGALIRPLPTNHAQAAALLTDLAQEVRRRAEVIAAASEQLKGLDGRRPVLNRIDKFNSVCHRLGLQPLPALVAFGDELRGLMDDKKCAQAVDIITSEGRKFGVYFVGGSQSWKADVVDTATRSMFWTRYLLPGIPVQQAAAIMEMDQKAAKPLVNRLRAPGMCALWRRGHQTQIVKAPYIDLESDRAWDAIEAAAATRGGYGGAPLQSATESATGWCSGVLRGTGAPAPYATDGAVEHQESSDSDTPVSGIAVSEDERRRILQVREEIIAEGRNPSKREICRRAFDGMTGGQAFKKVQEIIDNLDDDPPDAFRQVLQ